MPRSEREDGCVSAVAKPAVCVCVVLCEVAYQSTEAVMVGNGAPGGRTRLPGMIECGIGSVVLNGPSRTQGRNCNPKIGLKKPINNYTLDALCVVFYSCTRTTGTI